jgi:hypothetical protein
VKASVEWKFVGGNVATQPQGYQPLSDVKLYIFVPTALMSMSGWARQWHFSCSSRLKESNALQQQQQQQQRRRQE